MVLLFPDPIPDKMSMFSLSGAAGVSFRRNNLDALLLSKQHRFQKENISTSL
jgi:hypothetical protein